VSLFAMKDKVSAENPGSIGSNIPEASYFCEHENINTDNIAAAAILILKPII
jgi:hypothetical protein